MMYGSDEQKQQHLGGITSGEVQWCQGYSEPGSGSDLASLQTKAVRDGDDYVINGQKIWTTLAHMAKKMILLARTDPDAPKHKGITYFIVDMKSPGVTVQPLMNMADTHEFNEVYFDNVRVPKENVIGEENRGWYSAMTTLDFERSAIGSTIGMKQGVESLIEYARGHTDDHTSALDKNPMLRYEVCSPGDTVTIEHRAFYAIDVMHSVPSLGFTVQNSGGVFAVSCDTKTNQTLWPVLNRCDDLRVLVIEVSFPDEMAKLAADAGHYCPKTLTEDLKRLNHEPEIWLTGMKPGQEELILQQVNEAAPGMNIQMLSRGTVLTV